jgi:hypothetical protein
VWTTSSSRHPPKEAPKPPTTSSPSTVGSASSWLAFSIGSLTPPSHPQAPPDRRGACPPLQGHYWPPDTRLTIVPLGHYTSPWAATYGEASSPLCPKMGSPPIPIALAPGAPLHCDVGLPKSSQCRCPAVPECTSPVLMARCQAQLGFGPVTSGPKGTVALVIFSRD